MTSSNRTPSAAPVVQPRKKLTLLKMLALIAFAGLAVSALLHLYGA